jgi:multisubunit Na+/H+ antiporter MnhE subunit
MTPGSLVTDIDDDKSNATVHIVFVNNENDVFEEVQKMQNKIKRFIA